MLGFSTGHHSFAKYASLYTRKRTFSERLFIMNKTIAILSLVVGADLVLSVGLLGGVMYKMYRMGVLFL